MQIEKKTETKKEEKTKNIIEKTEITTKTIEKENLIFQERIANLKMMVSKEMMKDMKLTKTVFMISTPKRPRAQEQATTITKKGRANTKKNGTIIIMETTENLNI